ncbi:hypothetical protein [Photorhabdus heterorhabditis]|uniref:Uncharacterized protein n=1 Tax=Photorhabdus heterorhabditis TaxID=880156 RepID=A0A5B0X866_9GAMM|nr:hypothetical protein [Photorhabdus heterorhabditis]KAA1195493.1 hypothetical protein F0L16_02075 [Photorhabdus heterorhabditis]
MKSATYGKGDKEIGSSRKYKEIMRRIEKLEKNVEKRNLKKILKDLDKLGKNLKKLSYVISGDSDIKAKIGNVQTKYEHIRHDLKNSKVIEEYKHISPPVTNFLKKIGRMVIKMPSR